MESTTILRSFQYAVGKGSVMSVLEKPGMVSTKNASFSSMSKLPMFGGKSVSSTNRHGSVFIVSCVKTSETTVAAIKSNSNGSALLDSQSQGLTEKKSPFSATFPTGFEDLLTEVCDETKIAELKVKFGAFEINMKRNIDSPTTYAPPPTIAPPVLSIPADSTPTSPPPKPSAEKTSAFMNVSVEKASKLAALEASGSTGYVLVSSPTVGSFRRGRTLKGKKQPPACKEGDVIKEGQVIGFVDQFATELPIRSNVAGEVLKLLYTEGEAVGYGDPLIAVLPSFHGIK